jgi:hypothetical protein
MTTVELNKTRPGMHPQFILGQFDKVEQKILGRLSTELFITSGGKISLLKSEYSYFLLKPTSVFSEMFNIDREILCIFSAYENFEPRTLDAFHIAQSELADLRVETVYRILSNDSLIEKK